MNKTTKVILVAACFLLTAVTLVPITVAHSESDPMVRTLWAGQDINAGTVSIWNDETNLHVVYDADNGWVITGTHLYVGKTNPNTLTTAPGQFPYSGNTEYVIPLSMISDYKMQLNKNGAPTGKMIPTGTPGVDQDDIVYIAAHADVKKETQSSGYLEVVSDTTTQWLGGASHVDGATWSNAFACWVHPAWANILGATWIWRTVNTDSAWEYANVPQYDTTYHLYGWLFKKTFTLPSTAHDITGNIQINSDNAFVASLNGVPVGGEGGMYLDGPDTHDYASVTAYGPAGITAGLNTLSIRALNYFNWGSSTGNPAGLAFKAEIWYDYISCVRTESAWACGTDFDHPNWAMYFSYGIQGWEQADTYQVSATTATPKLSNIVLTSGEIYKIKASGIYYFRTAGSSSGYQADAEFALRHDAYGEGWTKGDTAPYGAPYNGLDLCTSAGTNINWGNTVNLVDHSYTISYTGAGATLSTFIKDDAYTDNSGYLTVTIYQWA
jgi:hypothetical protein